jgi:hypothetical protein
MIIERVAKSETTDMGLSMLYNAFAEAYDSELMGLVGACSYAGETLISRTAKGTHFTFCCPNKRTFKAMERRALDLFIYLDKIFPITRLHISTMQDPIYTIPADYWQSKGVMYFPPGWLGFGGADDKDWYVLCRLDKDGLMVKEATVTKKSGVRKRELT